MDLNAQLQQALAEPAGAHPELLGPTFLALFKGQLSRELPITSPEKLDGLLRHLTGGRSWAPELIASKQSAMAYDGTLALGFRDASLADVEAFAAINDIPTAHILAGRPGDDADALLAFSQRATGQRAKHASLCAAIAAGATGVEGTLELRQVGSAALAQRAMERLGPERASEVVLRALYVNDGQPEFRDQALSPVFSVLGAPLPQSTLDAIAERVELLKREVRDLSWETLGDWLSRGRRWAECIAFARARVAKDEGWRRALRMVLDKAVVAGFVLDPSLDEFIDPAGAARLTHDVWLMTKRLLEALPPERAVPMLLDAPYARPNDVFRFVMKGLPRETLERLAVAHVALRDDPDAKDLLIATKLMPFGPDFGDALKVALADVKPKPAYLKALKMNLDAQVFAGLEQWLATRPEPAKKPAAKKKKD